MTNSNTYDAHPGDRILACDWCDDVGLVALIRKADASLAIASNQGTLSVPDEWREHASGLVAFSKEHLIVWPVEMTHGGQCKVGVFKDGRWSTATLAAPLALFSNERYLAVTYGEERAADDDGSLFSDMATIYEAGTLRRLCGVGSGMRNAGYQGVLMEVEACCFDDQDRFYFVAYDTPYIWSCSTSGDGMKSDLIPVAPSYVYAITAEAKGIHLITEDNGAIRVYSRLHGQEQWTDRRPPKLGELGRVELKKASILGKPGGKLLVYTEKEAEILDLRRV